MREKKINGKIMKWVGIGVLALAAAVILAGIIAWLYVGSHFIGGTKVNGIDVSGMKMDELKETVKEYSLEITERNKDSEEDAVFTEKISGDEIGMQVKSDEALYEILEEQSVWDLFSRSEKEHQISDCLEYDEEALEEKVTKLKGLQKDFADAPENAYISDYDETSGEYQIVEEKKGNLLDKEQTLEAIKNAVSELQASVDLDQEDCYQKPEITQEDEKLNDTLQQLNKYVSAEIRYEFGENTELLDGSTIHKWLKVTKKNNIRINTEKLEEFVASLRKKYDTIFRSRKFKTVYGNTVTIDSGDYGWWMNYEKEEKELLKLIKKGKKTDRVPEYFQTAKEYGKKDYGDTYVEINLTAQQVFFIKNGKKILETECVTGNSSRGYDTPAGAYSLTYKQRDATLNGENYSTPVNYWMPFNGNIGLHDAYWRSRFGGSEYKYNGSHGCVNLPPEAAKKLYSYVEAGTPVICYHLEVPGINENKDSNKKDKEETKNNKETKKKAESNTEKNNKKKTE